VVTPPARTSVIPASRTASVRVRAAALVRNPVFWVWVAAIIAIVPQPWHQLRMQVDPIIDLHVYRDAGVSLLHHEPVYSHYTITRYSVLPFTYPPLAALLAIPFAAIPLLVLGALWDIAVYAVLAYVLWVVLAPIREQLRTWMPGLVPYLLPAAWLASAYLLVIRQQIHFGQVGLFLMALIVVDLLTPLTGRWRGVLVGFAAAIKLTPGIFIVGLFVAGRRDTRRASWVAAATFVLLSGLSAVVAPGGSRAYWGSALFDSNRLGDNSAPANQSLRGMMLRTALDPGHATIAFVLLAVVVGAVGLWKASVAWRQGDDLFAVSLIGLLMALLSPVAWIHHFVFMIPLVIALARDHRWVPAILLGGLGFTNWANIWNHQLLDGNMTALGPMRTVLVSTLGISMALAVLLLRVRSGAPRRPRP